MHGLEAIPNTTEHRAATIKGSTIHFQLSTHEPLQAPAPQEQADTNAQAQPSADLGVVCSYNGPGCYIKPKAKSNLQIIRNAICTVCLAGDVNMSLKQKILVVRVLGGLYEGGSYSFLIRTPSGHFCHVYTSTRSRIWITIHVGEVV